MRRFLNDLSIEQYGKIKFAKQLILQKKSKKELSGKKKVIWFLDAPDYGNLGDQAIAYAIHKFCRDNLPEREIIEFQESNVLQYLAWIKNNIKEQDIIVLQGGGNLGDLYPRYEFIRRTIVKNFSQNKIIVFPQSVSYRMDKSGEDERKIAAEIYGKHKNITLFARDSHSYKKMKKIFPNTNIQICPDIVFYLVGVTKQGKRNGLGICLRNDKEKNILQKDVELLIEKIKDSYSYAKKFDTICKLDGPISYTIRKKIVLAKLEEISKFEMVVTDRLHGMIFSYVTSTPCISLNNSTGKSANTYKDWISKAKSISFVLNDYSSIELPIMEPSKKLNFES